MEALSYIKYTIEEVAAMESHAELISHHLVITDKTTVEHNRAIRMISTALERYIEARNGDCEVFTENVALYCNELCNDDANFFLPDVMTVCDSSGIHSDGVHSVPVFVAEVTSESTKKQDYTDKMAVYAKIGVQEYWVVDLQRKVIVRYLVDNDYAPEMMAYPHFSSIAMHTYPDLSIELSRIFENI